MKDIVKEFEQKFCTTIGADNTTVARWLNVGDTSEDNYKLTKDIVVWLQGLNQAHEEKVERAVKTALKNASSEDLLEEITSRGYTKIEVVSSPTNTNNQ